MKRFISTLLLVALAGSVFASTPAPSPFDPTAARKTLSNVVPATGRAALDVYSKEESDALAAQSTLRYYFNEASSDIAGFEAFATSPVAVQAGEAKTLGTSIALVDQWITPVNTPNLTTLVSGIYEMEMYFSTTGAGSAYIVPELWIYTAAGAEKQHVATDSVKIISGAQTKDLQTFRFSVPAAVSLASTDRLVVKLYAYRAGVQSLVIWYGGATDAFFGVPISPRNFLRTDGSNPSDLATVKNNLQIPNNASFTFDGLSGEVTYADFNELADTPAYEEGRVFWDKDNGTLGMYSDVDGSAPTTPILQIGQEHWIRIKHAGVATITTGTVVCLTSPLTGKDPIALIADASNPAASRVVGVVTSDIAPDGTGFATALGLVRNLNTEGLTEGSKVFLSATTPGSFTDTVPAAPNSSIIVGYVVKAHATAGSIYVRVWLNGAIERANFGAEAYFDGNVRVDADILLESNGDTSRIYKTANAGNYDKPISIYAGGVDFTNAENGGQISLYGKDDEEPTLSGNVDIIAGADATGTGDIRLLTGDISTERIVIDGADGDINLKATTKVGGNLVATGGTIRKFYGETIDDELMFKSGPLTGTGSYILMEAPAVTFSADIQRGSRFQWYADDTNPSSALMYLFGDETISSYTLQLNGDAYITQGLKIGGDISCSGTLYLDESPLIGGADVLALKSEIPNNASFSFDGLSDSPAYTGHAGEVLALDGAGSSLEWRAAPLGVMASAETTSYTLTANTVYTVTALTGRQRIMVQNLSTYENIWVAPGSTNATVAASICIGPLAAFSDDYDDTIDFAIIASTAQPIAILQEGE
jgi:hypothetical protein